MNSYHTQNMKIRNRIKNSLKHLLLAHAFKKNSDEDLKLMIGSLHSRLVREVETLNSIQDVEFKVFSQYGDDGIIQWLIKRLNLNNQTFVEFGVQDYTESNTRFLLINSGWNGLVIDGSEKSIEYVKAQDYYWKNNLTAIAAFITRENIDGLITSAGISGEIGLLHIDLDGNDYWIWEAIKSINPIIMIAEYNSVFGDKRPITVPYDKNFFRTEKHHSNLYFGASLPALCHLATKKGYTLIGSNSAGNNAYFIRNDHVFEGIPTPSIAQAFVNSQFRESRDKDGALTFASGLERARVISNLPVWNVVESCEEKF